MKEVLQGDSVHSLLSVLDVITVSHTSTNVFPRNRKSQAISTAPEKSIKANTPCVYKSSLELDPMFLLFSQGKHVMPGGPISLQSLTKLLNVKTAYLLNLTNG